MIKGRELVLFIDAIDNADFAASQRSEVSFPIKLLELLDSDPIPGLKVVVSCRTERKPATYAQYHELILRPFSINETSAFLRSRIKKVSQVEINVAHARSGATREYLLILSKMAGVFLMSRRSTRKSSWMSSFRREYQMQSL